MQHVPVLEQLKREVQIGGETLVVSPLTVRRIPAFARAIDPAFPSLANLITDVKDGSPLDYPGIISLIADHGDALIQAMAVATGKDENFFGDSQADEFAALVFAVIEVNVDFFAQRLAPRLLETLAGAVARMERLGAGLTPSKS